MKKTLFIFALLFLFSGICFPQWNIIYTANPAQTMSVIRFYNNSTGYCSSSLYNSSTFNIYKTTNAGANWTAQSSGRTGMGMTDLCVRHPDTAYFVGIYGTLLRTFNGGINWDSTNLGNYTHLRGITFLNSFTGFAIGDGGIMWKTTDKGLNWSLQSSFTISSLNRIRFVNQTTGYITASANFAYKTTDAGNAWINLNFPFIGPIDFLRELVFIDENTGYVSGDIGRIRKTTNGGINWTLLTTPTTEPLFSISAAGPNVLFACGGAGKVIKTTDAGNNWTLQSTTLNEYLYGIAMVSPDTGYICSWSGKILKTTNGGAITGINPGVSVAEGYYLGQNYPNPFNPETEINFTIPENGPVSIKIFDITGREVESIVNKVMIKGSYTVNYNASRLTSGMYFYKLVAGDKFSDAKKMILIK